MIRKVMLLVVLAVFISVLSPAKSAYAHFVIEDKSTGVKALFHVAPDDNPIAGQESTISFDFSQTGFAASDFSFTLSVKSTKADAVTVPLDVYSNVVIAKYTFPSQGFYDITLTATRKSDSKESKIRYGQRVSRGVIAEPKQPFGAFEIGVIAGVILISIGAVAFSLVSNRHEQRRKDDTKNHK